MLIDDLLELVRLVNKANKVHLDEALSEDLNRVKEANIILEKLEGGDK